MQSLNAADINVQLKHLPAETSWEDLIEHGHIRILDAEGTAILRKDGFQHNRNLRNGGARDGSAVEGIVTEVTSALATKTLVVPTTKVAATIDAKAGAPAA